ncbi:MAG TPA: site-2 protease family protein [Caldilinea sp.]|nr:hypothetical protein [Anaerolineales bacterium]HRA67399.1 site-2 protease family protein [Caldilinea sp.]
MQSLTPDQFSLQAVRAFQQAGSIAGRSRAETLACGHLLAGVLAQKDGDAFGVLAALGHDPAAMAKQIKEHFGSRQMVVWRSEKGDGAQNKLEPSLQHALETAFGEARAVGSPFATTRDLLVGVIDHPDSELAGLLAGWQIDRNAVVQAPVSVYERSAVAVRAEAAQARAAKMRPQWRISPVFLGLVAAMIVSGVALYMLEDPSPVIVFVFVTPGWIVSLALHEFGHAMTAYIGGDYSVEERGYLTLNPLKYTHPVLSIVMPVVFLLLGGIGLPGGAVYINRAAIRSRWMNSMVSAAGPAANAIFAALLAIPFLLNNDIGFFLGHLTFWSAIALLIFLQITAIVLNLLPMPGLDGFGVLAPWLPLSVLQMLQPLYSFGYLLLIFLFWYVEAFSAFFWTVVWQFMSQLNVIPDLVSMGFSMYRFWMQ